MMTSRLYGKVRLPSRVRLPLIQLGFSTPTFCAPNKVRTVCISTNEMPQVASSVSSGRPYKNRITLRSMSAPTSAALPKATGSAASKYQSNQPGNAVLKNTCTAQVA